jgi:hypothetical protein
MTVPCGVEVPVARNLGNDAAARADELETFVKGRLSEGALVNARRTGDEIRTRARLKARLSPQQ